MKINNIWKWLNWWRVEKFGKYTDKTVDALISIHQILSFNLMSSIGLVCTFSPICSFFKCVFFLNLSLKKIKTHTYIFNQPKLLVVSFYSLLVWRISFSSQFLFKIIAMLWFLFLLFFCCGCFLLHDTHFSQKCIVLQFLVSVAWKVACCTVTEKKTQKKTAS